MNTHFLKYSLVASLLVLCAPGLRADEEQDLVATLQSSADIPAKCATCQKLRTIGTVKSVPALAALLGEERTSHAARYALEGMPYPEAATAMRQALATTSGSIKAGLIDSLGWRHDTASVPLLIPLLPDGDMTIATAAATALGRIGTSEARAALITARDKVPPALQAAAVNALLQCAEASLAANDVESATKIYRPLFEGKFPEQVRVAAWRGLVYSDPDARGTLTTQALLGENVGLQIAALKVLRELNDRSMLKACLDQWSRLSAEAQVAVLSAAVKFDQNPLPTVHAAIQSEHLVVRVAAWQAFGDVGAPADIPALAKAAAQGDTVERQAARDSLARLHGTDVREALVKALDSADSPEKVELIRALGERNETQAAPVLLKNTGAAPEPVRLAALDALGKLAVPDTLTPLLELAAKSSSEAQCEKALHALSAICQGSPDKEQTSRLVLDGMGPLQSAERCRVLPLLPELATPAALAAAQAASRDRDPELAKTALRVLSQWPNAAPAPGLLEFAKASTEPVLQVLALRAYIAVAGQEPDPGQRLALLRQAMSAAKRVDEKKLALAQVGQLSTPEALAAVMADLAEPGLETEAGLAALAIAEKLGGTNPALARETELKVLGQCDSVEMVKRAWAVRGKPAAAGPFIQDWLISGLYNKPGVSDVTTLFDVGFAPEKPGENVTWKPVPHADWVNLGAVFPDQDNCVAYLKTQLTVPEETYAVLLIGSDDGVKAWLNGKVVHASNVLRGDVADQDMAPLKLVKGANELMLKITQGTGGWSARARIMGVDNRPVPELRVVARTESGAR